MNAKAWWKSKTIWASLIVAVIAIIQAVTGFIPEGYVGYVLLVVAVLGIVLRYLTGQPIALKDVVGVINQIEAGTPPIEETPPKPNQ